MNSDSPATHRAEKPKPAKPRTMPAAKTTHRAASNSGQGIGSANTGGLQRRAGRASNCRMSRSTAGPGGMPRSSAWLRE